MKASPFSSGTMIIIGGIMLLLVILWWTSFRQFIREEMSQGALPEEFSIFERAKQELTPSFQGLREAIRTTQEVTRRLAAPPLSSTQVESIEQSLRDLNEK